MSLTVTVGGEEIDLSAKATWGPYYMAHPKWKFGDVVGDSGRQRAMVIADHSTYADVVFLDPVAFGTVPRSIEAADRWELVPEPDD